MWGLGVVELGRFVLCRLSESAGTDVTSLEPNFGRFHKIGQPARLIERSRALLVR